MRVLFRSPSLESVPMLSSRYSGLLLVAPALTVIGALFVFPLGYSIVGAFTEESEAGAYRFSLGNFLRAFELYSDDILFTIIIIGLATVMIGLGAILIGGYITIGDSRLLAGMLRALYRWPLFIPFIVAAQCMRTFLANNGLMNLLLVELGLLPPPATARLPPCPAHPPPL